MKYLLFPLLVLAFAQCKQLKDVRPDVDADTLSCVTDTLTMEWMKRYEGRYRQIEHLDTIFELLASCDFSSDADKRTLPVYVHVMGELANNDHADGYVGELFADKCYGLFRNHPDVLWPYVSLLEAHERAVIYGYMASGVYYADISREDLDMLLEHQEERFSRYKNEMNEFRDVLSKAFLFE